MSDTTDLIQRLRTAWTYCGVEQTLRLEAADALEQQAAQIAEKDAEIARLHKALDSAYAQAMENGATANALRADAERLTTALNKIAERQNSDWPDRCQALVNTARAALRQEQPNHFPDAGKMVQPAGEQPT